MPHVGSLKNKGLGLEPRRHELVFTPKLLVSTVRDSFTVESTMTSYANLLGPLLIGTVFNTFIYGICVLQFITYWQFQQNDQLVVKYDYS